MTLVSMLKIYFQLSTFVFLRYSKAVQSYKPKAHNNINDTFRHLKLIHVEFILDNRCTKEIIIELLKSEPLLRFHRFSVVPQFTVEPNIPQSLGLKISQSFVENYHYYASKLPYAVSTAWLCFQSGTVKLRLKIDRNTVNEYINMQYEYK